LFFFSLLSFSSPSSSHTGPPLDSDQALPLFFFFFEYLWRLSRDPLFPSGPSLLFPRFRPAFIARLIVKFFPVFLEPRSLRARSLKVTQGPFPTLSVRRSLFVPLVLPPLFPPFLFADSFGPKSAALLLLFVDSDCSPKAGFSSSYGLSVLFRPVCLRRALACCSFLCVSFPPSVFSQQSRTFLTVQSQCSTKRRMTPLSPPFDPRHVPS